MAPSSAVRSFAITLVIAIAVTGPQTSGFAIDRKKNSLFTTQSTDVSSDNFQLQVKNDLKRPNDIKFNTDGESNNTTVRSDSDVTLSPEVIKEPPDMTTTRPPSLTYTTEAIRSTTEDTRIPTISSDTVEVFDSVEDVGSGNIEKTKENSTKTIKQNEFDSKGTVKSVENKHVINENSNETTQSTVTYQTAVTSDITGKTSLKTSSVRDTTKIINISETTTESVETSTTKIAENIDISTDATFVTEFFSQTVPVTSFVSTIPTEDSSTPTEPSLLSSTLPDSDMTQTTTDILEKYTKYTTIIRKRINSSEDTQKASLKDDSMKAETSNTQLLFDKEFGVPSLKKKRIDLPSNMNHRLLSGTAVFEETRETTVSMQPTIPTVFNIKTIGPKRKETVQAKRGGFLDNSEKATSPLDASVTTTVRIENDAAMYGAVDDSEAADTESPDFKKANVTDSESQRQLAEDAIQEELLKEETLNDHNDNVNRYRDVQNKNEGNKGEEQPGPGASPLAESEGSLDVQPINPSIKTTLYTVSPSYKPMKKIDVQPAKPFVRDPDDNSWRNESISSLGIVFKPKVSSKSFKEVLKNKTQTEFNNFQEKDTKDNVPDLRVRLEKIAEVRKTKKKMNKDGEEVYSDYEEGNSAETASTPKPDLMPSLLSSAEVSKLLTPFNFPTDFELTTPTSNDLDTNKGKTKILPQPSQDPLTTQKPKKKVFDIAEYYDTTDEYDADYFTMSKIDLKKFTQPTKTTQTPVTYPIGPLLTRPTQPYFADRKPTVQYFPPREPLKVNVNNLDPDFERKVNLFTFTENPKTEPRSQFVTTPSAPIATENPKSEIRPALRPEVGPDIRSTVKPTDLLMYTPGELSKSYYLTNAPRVTEPQGFVINDGSLNRGSYVIKHYKDFLNAAVKDNDDERHTGFLPYHTPTEPSRDVTFSMIEAEQSTRKGKQEDNYDTHFRKEVLNRFVDNFNQNSERFKVDFPILYNNSIVHRSGGESGRPLASSRAFLKRLYNGEGTATKTALLKKPCDPHCDVTVELSPAYELHYYVPGEEEKEELEPPPTEPYGL